jgi:hypothetical protein
MRHYSFTLRVDGIDLDGGRYEDALYEAGCDDALVSVVNGSLRVDFDRDAPTFEAAVAAATLNVQRAGGRVLLVEPIQG